MQITNHKFNFCASAQKHRDPQYSSTTSIVSANANTYFPSIKMSTIKTSAIEELKSNLSLSSTVVTPDSENYTQSIKRWAASAEKPAVGFPSFVNSLDCHVGIPKEV